MNLNYSCVRPGFRIDGAALSAGYDGETLSLGVSLPSLGMQSVHIESAGLVLDSRGLEAQQVQAGIDIEIKDGSVGGITVRHLRLPRADLAGLVLHLPAKDLTISLPEGQRATALDLDLQGLKLALTGADPLQWLQDGTLRIGTVSVSRLQAALGERITAETSLQTGTVTATFSDGTVQLSVDGVGLSAGAELLLGDDHRLGLFRAQGGHIDSIEGSYSADAGAQLTLRGAHLGPATYDDGLINIELDDLIVDVVHVDAGGLDREGELHLPPQVLLRRAFRGLPMLEGRRIVSVGNILLDQGSLRIDDLMALGSYSTGPDLSAGQDWVQSLMDSGLVGTMQGLAEAASGEGNISARTGRAQASIQLRLQEGALTPVVMGIPAVDIDLSSDPPLAPIFRVENSDLFSSRHHNARLEEQMARIRRGNVTVYVLGRPFVFTAESLIRTLAGVPAAEVEDVFRLLETPEEADAETTSSLGQMLTVMSELSWPIQGVLDIRPTHLYLGTFGEVLMPPLGPSLHIDIRGALEDNVDLNIDPADLGSVLLQARGMSLTTGAVSIESMSTVQINPRERSLEAVITRGRISYLDVIAP